VRRRRALIYLAILVALVAGVAGGTFASVLAYYNIKGQAIQLQADLTAHLQSGQTELEAARTSLTAANTTHDSTLVSQASVHFTTAKLHFTVARQMANSSQMLIRMEDLPTVGGPVSSRHKAVNGIAEMGIAISDAGVELANLEGQLIKPPSGGQQGRTLLTVLEQTRVSLVKVRADLARAQKSAAGVDVGVLPAGQQASFVKARDTISSALTGLDEFERLVPVLTEMLGGNGARTYLIEQVNPAELRGGGGFIGTYSLLRADHGSLKVIRSGNAFDLAEPRPLIGQRGYVTPPGPMRESVLDVTSWSFPDSNFFPDFPSNAKAAENFVQPRLGIHIDAVISMDFYTVAKMLGLTGPITIPGIGTVSEDTFIPLALQSDFGAIDAAHKAMFSAISGPLMDRVASLPADRWPALISALNSLATARHLQAYFNNDTVQKEIDRAGWSGILNPTGAPDFMMEVENNLGPTKANYFIVRKFSVELTRNGATLHHKVTVDITNNMPYEYRPQEYYRAYLGLYVNAAAWAGSHDLRRVRYQSPAPPAGTVLIDGWLPSFHGYGHSAHAVFEYDTHWSADARGEGKIYWQKQPGTLDDKIDIIWHDGGGHTYTTSGDLGQDRVITLSMLGVTITPGQAGQANLPSLSLG